MTDELENRAEDVRSACDNLLDEVGEERRMYTRLRYRRCLLVGYVGGISPDIFKGIRVHIIKLYSGRFMSIYTNNLISSDVVEAWM